MEIYPEKLALPTFVTYFCFTNLLLLLLSFPSANDGKPLNRITVKYLSTSKFVYP